MKISRAFTLIEMLLATVIFASLLGGILQILAGISRDSRAMRKTNADGTECNIVSLVQWDLSNTDQILAQSAPIVLIGHGGIDRQTLTPNGRLVRVTYRISSSAGAPPTLWREQRYLDDPARPDPWREMVCSAVDSLSIMSSSAPSVSPRVDVNLQMGTGSIHQQLWVK